MATSQSNDSRTRGRFLPSIRSPVFNPLDESGITVVAPEKEEPQAGNNGGHIRRRFREIRKFFSDDRAARRSSRNSKSNKTTSNLPPVSPQPIPLTPTAPDTRERLSPADTMKTTARSKHPWISVERNLLGMTERSRHGSTISSSSSSNYGSGFFAVETTDAGLNEIVTTNDEDVKGTVIQVNSSENVAISNPNMTIQNDHSKPCKMMTIQNDVEEPSVSKEPLVSEEQEDKVVVMFTNPFDLKREFKKARASKNYTSIVDFLTSTFSSLRTLSEVFKASEYDLNCGINAIFVDFTYDILMALPNDHQKTVLKSVVNCLLSNIRNKRIENYVGDLAGYLILLQNPQFDSRSSYVIFSHLLRQVSALSNEEHHTLVSWMRWLPISSFKAMISRLKVFVTVSLFSESRESDLPPLEKTRLWVPSAVKVLALLNASNWLNNQPIVHYMFMYIEKLNHLDLTKEYDNWQRRSYKGIFTFCQYPFLLPLSAKRFILQKDSESQMIEIARRSLLQGVKKRELPVASMLFLNLRVRRDHIISDSLNEISHKRSDLKKKLKVTFVGEPGVDIGGLTKEWFMLLIRKIFRPEYGMFRYNEKSSCYWFTNMAVDNLAEFHLVGVLMGLAVYNGTILDIRFPLCCYKKLLSPAVVPEDRNAIVGVTGLHLSDLKEVMPDLAKGLQELLIYEGNVEDDMCQTFQVSSTEFGSVVTANLKENGDSIPVTNENRQEYVDLYVDYILNKSIHHQFAAFYRGFHGVCASNALIMFLAEEVEMLVCGNPDFNMRALAQVTIYDGFSKRDDTIRYFWETVERFSNSLKRKLLRFCTGSDRIPVGGVTEMAFKITRMANAKDEMLPMAHTCFNQLCLPSYKTRQQLKNKLIVAISNSEGFGIE